MRERALRDALRAAHDAGVTFGEIFSLPAHAAAGLASDVSRLRTQPVHAQPRQRHGCA
ncbi:hypothetical protein PUN4_620053 [Paraburkholderia unamae]|nr:hypothetical protein PUN4_620053 [Paraburkholderia unamae]